MKQSDQIPSVNHNITHPLYSDMPDFKRMPHRIELVERRSLRGREKPEEQKEPIRRRKA